MDNVYKGGEYEPFKKKSKEPNASFKARIQALNIKSKISLYFDFAKDIHEYFGYKEDWVTIPLESQLDSYWMLSEADDVLVYSDKPITKETIEEGKEIYGALIYRQRFLPKWVYPTEDMTLICADTRTDGNKYLMIFDNAKECKDEELKKKYVDKWES